MKNHLRSPVKIKIADLICVTLAYLVLPYIIFFAGWLKWWIALPLCIAILVPLLRRWSQFSSEAEIPLGQIVVILLVTLVAAVVCGAGGLGHQMADWDKHNAMLYDLTTQSWPVTYSIAGQTFPLSYYFAYYLPAAAIGKIFGWTAANVALWAWTFLGLLLTLVWFRILLSRKAGVWAPLLFLFFSGLDIIGFLLVSGLLSAMGWDTQPLSELEWWGQGWNYMSFAAVIFWFPGQGIAAWLSSALVIKLAEDDSFPGSLGFFAWAATAFWVPFVTLGLLPLLLLLFRPSLPSWRECLDYLAGGLLLVCTVLLYLAKMVPPLPSEIVGPPIASGWIWTFARDVTEIGLLAFFWPLFWLLECGIYGILAWKLLPGRMARRWLAAVLIVLGLIPLYRFGYYNDMSFKASLPAIFLLAVLVGRALFNEQNGRRARRAALATLLVIGSITVLIEFGLQIEGMSKRGTVWRLPAGQSLMELKASYDQQATRDLSEPSEEFDSFLRQYVGSSRSFFFDVIGGETPPDSVRVE
jgi:hypothetical protein